MFRASLSDTSLFINPISTISELIDEGIFKISKEGISLVAADRAMVAVVDFLISSQAFESYELDEERSIGLNITNFLSVLKRVKAGDKLTLSLTDNKLEVLLENSSKRRFVIPLLELTQEEIPPIEQLEFSAKSEIKPEVLQAGIEDAEVVADSVLFIASPSSFKMKAEGDISGTELELEKGSEGLIGIETKGEIKARYPLDYLKKMIKVSRIADSVVIEFGQDYPMKLGFKAGNKVFLNFVLAPRVIESE